MRGGKKKQKNKIINWREVYKMKLQIKLSKNQLTIISRALDLYSRILCGQIEEVPRAIAHVDFNVTHDMDISKRYTLEDAINTIKQIMFPNIYPATHGISSEGLLPRKAAIAYDIFQVIDKLQEKREVIFKTTEEEELPTIEVLN